MTSAGISGGFFEALVNSLILGAFFVLALELVFRVAPRTGAATRYLCWWMALLAVVVLPVFTSTSGGEHSPPKGYVARTILPTSGHNPNDGRIERDRKNQQEDDEERERGVSE